MKSSPQKITLTIITLMLLYTLSGCTDFFLGTFKPAGEKTPVTVPKSTYSTLLLEVQVNVGSIKLDIIPTATYLVDVVNTVSIREGSGGTLEEAKTVSSAEINPNTMKIAFDSADDNMRVDYKYDLTIKVANNITLQIDFLASTGHISANLLDQTVNISAFTLETSTGSISVSMEDLRISDSSPTMKTSTGAYNIILSNLRYSSSISWLISSSTGSIDLELTDNLPQNVSSPLSHTFTLECSTGSIDVLSDLHQDIGLQITADVSTGTIDIPGTGDSYTSENFASALVKYLFDLSTSTGNIYFTIEG